jgi:hypothetical protein
VNRLSKARRSRLAIVCAAALVGCASTKVETSGTGMKEPLCPEGSVQRSALVYWTTQWRPDQKEPALREAAALRGIERFFGDLSCIADIRRNSGGIPSDAELLRPAGAPVPDRIVFIVVRELGPKLVIGIPAIVEGGTEVLIDVRVLDVRGARSLAEVQTHWQHGGTFVIKGVKSLDQDMGSALAAALMPATTDQ